MSAQPEVHAGRRAYGSNLGGVNLLGRKKGNAQATEDSASIHGMPIAQQAAKDAGTAPKGRPTPKRSEATRKRGPVAPAPLTAAEARKRRKELGGPKLTREERKAEKVGAARRHGRPPRTDDGRRGRLPAAAGSRVRCAATSATWWTRAATARPVHARRARHGLRHAVDAVAGGAAGGDARDAGADPRHGGRRDSCSAGGSTSSSTRSSPTTSKAVGNWASTPRAGRLSCAGCGRRARRSSAATRLIERPPALRVLALGGIRSGKSAWAEATIASCGRPRRSRAVPGDCRGERRCGVGGPGGRPPGPQATAVGDSRKC